MTAGTFTLTFAMRESYKSGTNSNIGSAAECYYKYTVNVTVTDIAAPTAPSPPASVCYNGIGSVTLPFTATPSASPAGNTIEWFDAASGGTSLGTGNSLSIAGFVPTGPYPQTVTRYAETVTADGCCRSVSRTAVNVIINQAPTITASANSPACEGGTILLTSTPSNTLGSPTYNWDSPTASNISTLQNPAGFTATATSGGTYTVTVTNGSNTCTASATTALVVYPPATAAAAGTYTVTVTDSKGCSSTSAATVAVNTPPTFTATVQCTNGSGTNANQNEYYVQVSGLTAGSTYNISITGGSAGTGAAGLDGGLTATGLTGKTTYVLGPVAYASSPITISVTNTAAASCPVTAQINTVLCGYTVIAGADNLQNDLHASGYFCSSPATTGANPGGILAQAAPSVVNSGSSVTSQYVCIVQRCRCNRRQFDNTDVVLATNKTGLFPNIPNATYHVRAFLIPTGDITAFTAAVSGATNSAVTTAATPYCSGSCGSATYTINCCEAEAGTITNADIASCELLAPLNFTTTVTGNKVPDATYSYVYLLVDVVSGNVLQVNATGAFDLSALNVTSQTTFKVYGMSYRTADIASIPGATTAISDIIGDPVAAIIADASQLPEDGEFCGDLTDGGFDITINPAPTAAITGTISYCGTTGSATPLTATGGGTYLWSTGATATTAAITPVITTLGTTTYTVTVTSGGCDATASVTVYVNSQTTICSGTPISVSTTGCNLTGTYKQVFLLVDAAGLVVAVDAIDTDCAATFATTLLAVGDYKVYALNYDSAIMPMPTLTIGAPVGGPGGITAGCYNTTTFLNAFKCYTIAPLPVVAVTTNSPVCVGNPLTLTATVSSGTSTYSYNWNDNRAADLANSASTAYTVTVTNTAALTDAVAYEITVTDANGCSATNFAIAVVNATPDLAPMAPVTNTCPSFSVDLAPLVTDANNTTGTLSYYSTSADATAATSALPSSVVTVAGTYYIRKTTASGCFDVTSVAFTIVACPCLSTTTVCQGEPINVTTNNCNVTPPYRQAFFLTDAAGLIKAVVDGTTCSATFVSTTLPAGNYRIYALNYGTPAPTLPAVDSNINTITPDPIPMVGGACYNGDFLYNYKCVVVNALPVATVSNNGPICEGQALTLTANVSTFTPLPYDYVWSNGTTTNDVGTSSRCK
ncbi:MAG: hypothetical protein IPN94_20730 [Sphingobacteriales bacterium]|nr:hypothetical protein [Sphingobacteriales bacterium]